MKKIINQTRLQDFVLIMLVFGLCGATFIGVAIITPNAFLSGFFYWIGASCITCVLWIGFMLSKKRPKTEDDEFTLMVNDAEHWEKPNWIVVNSGSLYVGMMSIIHTGEGGS